MKTEIDTLDLHYIKFLTTGKQQEFLLDHLRRIESEPWQGLDQSAFVKAFDMIKTELALKPTHETLFERFLLAHLLVSRSQAPDWLNAFMAERLDQASHFPDMDPRIIYNGTWTSVRVPLISEATGKPSLQWFVAGAIQGGEIDDLWPAWASALLSKTSQEAIGMAAVAANQICPLDKGNTFFLFPLAASEGQGPIKGTSLGLPLALGLLHVASGLKISDQLLSTGAVKADGAIGPVTGLTEKRAIELNNERVSLFIYPAANSPLPNNDKFENLQADTLDQAWMFARLYAPGNGNRLAALAGMASDPQAFVDHMATVERHWIQELASRQALADVFGKVVLSPDLFHRFVSCVEAKLDGWQLDDAETYLNLLNSNALAEAHARSPLTCFRFYTAKLSLANHRGDVATARMACQEAESLFPIAKKGDLNRCVDFLNHRLVSRHNRFEFSPDLPAPLKEFVTMLEARYDRQSEFGCPTDTTLARLYGTMAQNYGFCGPADLKETLGYARKAEAAFGSGDVPEYRREALRQHSCLTYAFLDAGDVSAAQKSLFDFMETTDWNQVRKLRNDNRLTRWHHAAMARFIADTGDCERGKDYLDWCQHHQLMKDTDHPRQLWTYNLGRIALLLDRPETATRLFLESQNLCLSKANRPTIYVMALLPMSLLDGMGEGAGNELTAVIDTALTLNPAHFASLAGVDGSSLLESIRKAPESLFPFSYR